MARRRQYKEDESYVRPEPLLPANSPEARENQMISLAIDLAEKQLMDGTASAQVITHYLKLGTAQYKYELESLRRDNELKSAKIEDLSRAKHIEELYEEAMKAFREYSGQEDVVYENV